jgi:hypothetical protein
MKPFITVPLFILLMGVLSCATRQASPDRSTSGMSAEQTQVGWRQLFNGRDLDGWEHVGPGSFVVEDGVLRTEGGMGLLWYTREKFGNSVLRVVYRTTDPDSNSGIFIRIADRPPDEWFAVHHGFEVQIHDDEDEFHRTGAVYSLAPARKMAAHPAGEWNTMEITLRGQTVSVRLNGEDVTEFDAAGPLPERKQKWEPERGPRPEAGYIGLQNHDDEAKSQQGKATHVYFKEVSVKPL